MRIADLRLSDTVINGDPAREITGVSNDSRTTGPTDMYAAFPGHNVHGAQFVPQLVTSGVRVFLTDPAGVNIMRQAGLDLSALTVLVHDFPRGVAGHIAAQVYGTDPKNPRLLGITGTNGKTTTTFILDAFLTALGHRTGLIGTVATVVAGKRHDSVRTTPEASELHRLFSTMRSAGVDTCSMEVSSHALSQHRLDGATFAVAGFTNLSQDHLDFHGSMDNYFEAKRLLFTPAFAVRGVVVLADDWARTLATTSAIPVTTLSTNPGDNPDYLVTRCGSHWQVQARTGRAEEGTVEFVPPLPGAFNVTNTALALAMLHQNGVSLPDLARVATTTTVTVPGRMEIVNPASPRAIVDYSHTPDAIEKVLEGLEGDPVVIVLGAGGDRDPSKRAAMGRAAVRGADVVIVTDDNPRTEDPGAIRAQVLAGTREVPGARASTVEEHGDRAEAIRRGVAIAGANGTIVVAGKGHETGQVVAGQTLPFDDREQTREAVLHLRQ